MENFFVLKIEPGATRAEITTAYRQQNRDLHPDKTGSDPVKLEQLRRVQAAYAKLLASTPEAMMKEVSLEIEASRNISKTRLPRRGEQRNGARRVTPSCGWEVKSDTRVELWMSGTRIRRNFSILGSKLISRDWRFWIKLGNHFSAGRLPLHPEQLTPVAWRLNSSGGVAEECVLFT